MRRGKEREREQRGGRGGGWHSGEKRKRSACLRHICSGGELPDSHQTPAEWQSPLLSQVAGLSFLPFFLCFFFGSKTPKKNPKQNPKTPETPHLSYNVLEMGSTAVADVTHGRPYFLITAVLLEVVCVAWSHVITVDKLLVESVLGAKHELNTVEVHLVWFAGISCLSEQVTDTLKAVWLNL